MEIGAEAPPAAQHAGKGSAGAEPVSAPDVVPAATGAGLERQEPPSAGTADRNTSQVEEEPDGSGAQAQAT